MHSTIVYVLYGTVLCSVYVGGALGVDGRDTPLAGAAQPSASSVNTTVAKVIDAMLADGQSEIDGAIPIPEHHHDKAQRIVPRKGVDNDGVPGSATSARLTKAPATNLTVSSTSQSAIIAADDKPILAPTEAHGTVVAKPVDTSNATSGSASGGAMATTSSAAGSPSHVSLSNATATSNKTTGVSTSSVPSSSASALSTVSSTPAPTPTSKPPAVAGSTSTPRAVAPPANSTASTSTVTTSTASTTTTSSTTTTTKPPKKPKVTYSVEDEPKLLQAAKPGYASPYDPVDGSGRLRVDEPVAQFSKEFIPSPLGGRDAPNSRREYVVPIVTLIFAIPLLLGLFLLSYRRAKEFWLTRHYRRMDFLIDGMYNY